MEAIKGIIEAMKDLPETEKARLQGYGEGVAAMKQKMNEGKEEKEGEFEQTV